MADNSGKVLVTGAAGFIGSHLAGQLLDQGMDVLGLDNFNDFYDPALKIRNSGELEKNSRFRMFQADIRDAQAVTSAFDFFKPGVVIHMAAMAGVRPSIENPALYRDVNVNGTAVMLRAAAAADVGRMLFASSSSVYGNNEKVPFAEDDAVENQVSPYAETKIAAESLCAACRNQTGVPVTALRLFTVFGPRQRPDLAISRFLKNVSQGLPIKVYGDGKSSRDYTYVGDIVNGIVAAIDRAVDTDIINLGNSRPVTLTGLVETVEQVCGRQAVTESLPMQPGDVERTWADISRATQLLGYQPGVGIFEGIKRQWEWMNI